MSEIIELLKQIGETNEEKQRKRDVQKVLDNIVNDMTKHPQLKMYHWVADDDSRMYYQEIYDFFKAQNFTISNYQTEIVERNVIKRERNFYICW